MPSTGLWALMCSVPWPKAVGLFNDVDERVGRITDVSGNGQPEPEVDRYRLRSQKRSGPGEGLGRE